MSLKIATNKDEDAPLDDGADVAPWTSPLPARRRRRGVALGLVAALAASAAYAAGRATREVERPAPARALDLDRAALLEDAARVRLFALAGERVLTVRAEGERLLVAYDVDAIRVAFPAASPSFDDDHGPTLLDPEKLRDIVDEKLGEDSDHASEVLGGVLVVRGALSQQVTTARLLAALEATASPAALVTQLARARLVALVGRRALAVSGDGAPWLRVVYDVSDLVTVPPDFPAPEISLNLARGGGGGGASGGVLVFAEDDDRAWGLDPDKLVEIVEDKLGEDGDRVVEFANGSLVVRANLRHQEKTARLLRALAEQVSGGR
ncbi:MAG: hypothetical protein M9894_26200 [Planctomycetes bacterium]|nr:hypothetical protein [Planctomycetota bacterium]